MKHYIGDSVYVEFDGFSVILTTENGYVDDPSNRIVLEPEVYYGLIRYVNKLTDEKENNISHRTDTK